MTDPTPLTQEFEARDALRLAMAGCDDYVDGLIDAYTAAVTARVLADVAALRDAAQAYIDWRDLRLAQWKAVETCGHSDPFCPEMLVIRDTPMDKDDQMDEAIRQSLAHLTGGTDR